MILVYTNSENETNEYIKNLSIIDTNNTYISSYAKHNYDEINIIIAWNAPENFFQHYLNVEHIFTLGAGTDKFENRNDIKKATPIHRLKDGGMAEQIIDYVNGALLHFRNGIDIYSSQKTKKIWLKANKIYAKDMTICILGLGILGAKVAVELVSKGYKVKGWSRNKKDIYGCTCYSGSSSLEECLSESNVLISLLPINNDTRNIINSRSLSLLNKGSLLINVGRGLVINEEDCLSALSSGQLRFAFFDVFKFEPLPESSQMWNHPNIIITPHIAGLTDMSKACLEITENISNITRV